MNTHVACWLAIGTATAYDEAGEEAARIGFDARRSMRKYGQDR